MRAVDRGTYYADLFTGTSTLSMRALRTKGPMGSANLSAAHRQTPPGRLCRWNMIHTTICAVVVRVFVSFSSSYRWPSRPARLACASDVCCVGSVLAEVGTHQSWPAQAEADLAKPANYKVVSQPQG